MKLISKTTLRYCVTILLLILGWHIFSKSIDMPLLFPPPQLVIKSLFSMLKRNDVFQALVQTALRCTKAFVLSAAVGISIGIIQSKSQTFSDYFEPLLCIIRSVPVVSFILFALFYFKTNTIPVVVAFLMAFPIIADNTKTGLNSVPEKKKDFYNLFSISPFQQFAFVKFPHALPYIKASLHSSIGIIWKAVAAGEVLTLPKKSLGALLSRSQIILELQDVTSITILIILSSFFASKLLNLILLPQVLFQKLFFKIYFNTNLKDLPKKERKHHKIENEDTEIRDLTIVRDKKLYDNFNYTFKYGLFYSIIAPSGAGKTTLLDFIAGRLPQKNIKNGYVSSQKIAYLPQESYIIKELTAKQNIMLTLISSIGRKEAEKEAEKFLHEVGLLNKKDRLTRELSGGEKQRICIAMCFASDSSLLLLDEAFNSQDFCVKSKTLDLLQKLLNEKRKTTILVTHEIQEALSISDKVLCLGKNPLQIIYEKEIEKKENHKPSSLYLEPDNKRIEIENEIKKLLIY